jgi:hypothetical protein
MTNQQDLPSHPIPYRIRIGVTGHRNLGDEAALQAQVKHAIDNLVDDLFPMKSRPAVARVRQLGTTPISYRILSPLADGADRAVARAVLSYPHSCLDVVLPLVVEDYLETFADDASRAEFGELFSLCRNPVLLRTRRLRDERSDKQGQDQLRRDSYARVGRYVVDHCDILIAVWDGEPARGRGGTANVVEYAQRQRRPILLVWGGEICVLNPGNKNVGLDASALLSIDKFNLQSATVAYVNHLDYKHFEKPMTPQCIPAGPRAMVKEYLFPYYAKASSAAMKSQKQFHDAGKTIYTLSSAAVGCAALSVLFPPIAWVGYSAELVVLCFVWLTFWEAERGHTREAWIENRFLAERIRSGIFLAICGVKPKPIEVLPFMGYSQTANDWTVQVFDEIWGRLPKLAPCSQQDCRCLNDYIRWVWIRGQIRFHKKKMMKEGKAGRQLALAGKIVLPTTIVAAVLHLLLLAREPSSMTAESAHLLHRVVHQGLAFIALLFPAAAASLAGMEAHREYRRLEKRSANMYRQLKRLNWEMKLATDPESFETQLQQLDQEVMLRETQDWLMLMRYVEIKAG